MVCHVSVVAHVVHVFVPVVLPSSAVRGVVCHPDVDAEEQKVQLVPGDFLP